MKALISLNLLSNMNKLNTFRGPRSVLDYLNPDNNPPTPLVELPKELNPFFDDGVHIYAKLMNTLPLGNVKSLPSFNMLTEASKRGDLNNIDTVIENSSGNTVFSLAVIGKLMGINTTKAIVSNEVSAGKLKMLRLFGTEVIVNKEAICPDPKDKSSGIYKAKVWAKENNWFNAGQYDNTDNPSAHQKWTGNQIWEQTNGNIQIFVAGLGTTGTMVGVGKFLKEHNPEVQNIGIVRSPNNPVPGPRTRNLLQEIAFDWKSIVDHIETVGTIDSYRSSMQMCRNGLIVGPSSGFALAGLIKHLKRLKDKNALEQLRNEEGQINAVFIACDNPFPYLNEYFEYLPENEFPAIYNAELLNKKLQKDAQSLPALDVKAYELTINEAYLEIFEEDKNVIWQKILSNQEVLHRENVIVLDIRDQADFEHFQIPKAQNIELATLEQTAAQTAVGFTGKKVIVFCYRGNSSKIATALLRTQGIDAYTVMGGMIDWSKENHPRVRPDICKANMPIKFD